MARKTKIGTNANNRLDGLDGLFNLFGKGGNDLYLIDQASDRVIESANKGIDTVRIYDVRSYTLPYHVENLTVWETGLTATFRGNGLDNKLDARFIGFRTLRPTSSSMASVAKTILSRVEATTGSTAVRAAIA